MTSAGSAVRLDRAEALLAGETLGGTWSRCAVWLIRLAVEQELDALWTRCSPGVVRCRRRSQLLALGVVADRDTHHRVTVLWNVLSGAAHNHHYELAPGAAELRGWLGEARVLCSRLAGSHQSQA